jgi:hypothetical protein
MCKGPEAREPGICKKLSEAKWLEHQLEHGVELLEGTRKTGWD